MRTLREILTEYGGEDPEDGEVFLTVDDAITAMGVFISQDEVRTNIYTAMMDTGQGPPLTRIKNELRRMVGCCMIQRFDHASSPYGPGCVLNADHVGNHVFEEDE